MSVGEDGTTVFVGVAVLDEGVGDSDLGEEIEAEGTSTLGIPIRKHTPLYIHNSLIALNKSPKRTVLLRTIIEIRVFNEQLGVHQVNILGLVRCFVLGKVAAVHEELCVD